MTLRTCIECGEPSTEERCEQHRLPSSPKAPTTLRGYDWSWQQLSKRARRLQPFCSDCGATDDLTCDHSPEAWRRKAAGKTIRLQDVDVVCRSCNADRGRARPTGDNPRRAAPDPRWQAESESQIGHPVTWHPGGAA